MLLSAGAPNARRVASRYLRPHRMHGSRWLPSAHSFQALMKISESGAIPKPWTGFMRVFRRFTDSRSQDSYLSGVELMKMTALRSRRAPLSQPGHTQGIRGYAGSGAVSAFLTSPSYSQMELS